MIEATIIDYLTTKLDGIPVFLEMPEERPDEFVLIERTGGANQDRGAINSAMIAIQSWSGSLYGAASLNDLVKAAMLEIPNEANDVCECSLNSDYNFTDTTKKAYRYQAVYNITHY